MNNKIKSLDKMYLPETVKNEFKKWSSTGEMTNLFFYGPPGTGKTSSILAICRELYDPHIYSQCVYLCNFSYNRGIKYIRDRIRQIAQWTIPKISESTFCNPPFKVIILDEIDCITHEAQAALHNIMEEYNERVRFCLLCNNANKISQTLISMCTSVSFYHKNTDNAQMKIIDTILNNIRTELHNDEIIVDEFTNEQKTLIVDIFNSDIRRIEQFIQSYFIFKSINDFNHSIGFIPSNDFWDKIHLNPHEFNPIILADECIKSGWSALDLWNSYRIFNTKSPLIIEFWYKITQGIDDKILLIWFLARILKICVNK